MSSDPASAKPSSSGFKFLIVLMNVDFPVALRPVTANFTCSFFHLFKLLSMYTDTAIGPSFSTNRRKMSMSFTRLALTGYLFCGFDTLFVGTCKVQNEIETKRNETERNETKSNETKRNRTKRNETDLNEAK